MAGLLPKKELVSSHAVYRREIHPHGNQVDAHQTSGTVSSRRVSNSQLGYVYAFFLNQAGKKSVIRLVVVND